MKRSLVIIAAVLFLVVGAAGVWMVLRGETEEDRVVQSFDALKSAVETRDPDLLARYLHAEYSGWGGDRRSALDTFARAIERYSDAKIEVRERKVQLDESGNRATVDFEWAYRATIRSDIQTLTREQMDNLPRGMLPWEDAKAVFRKGPDGRWQLQTIDTRIPGGPR